MAGGVNPRVTQALLDGKRRWPELADSGPVAWRASMLPFVEYEDKSVGFGWPQMAVDAKEAFARFHRGEAPQPQDLLSKQAMGGGF